jgi:membrane protease YdiL (CAAX protease family)
MNDFSADLILYSLLGALLLSMVLGMILAWAWALGRIWQGRPMLPERPIVSVRPAQWGALTVFSVVVLYGIVNVEVSLAYATVTGRHAPTVKQAEPGKAQPHPNAPRALDKPKAGENHEMTQTDLFLQLAAINTLLLILVPLLVRCTSGATLADFGLSLDDWRRQLALGVGVALFMTPAVLATQIAAVQVWTSNKHPIEEMVLDSFSPGIALLAVASTIVLAPMIEELLFRGIVQKWLSRLAASLDSEASAPKDQAVAGLAADDLEGQMAGPSSSSCETLSIDHKRLGGPAGSLRASCLAIVSTSLFFAAMHTPQWPAPIAIFVLSAALGTLYRRTGSLLAVIAMHGTFNGFSTLILLLEALSRQIEPHHAANQAGPVIGLFF